MMIPEWAPVSPESVVINNFYSKTGALVSAEKVLSSCLLNVLHLPSYADKHCLPSFVHRVDAKPFVFGDTIPVLSSVDKLQKYEAPALLSSGSDSMVNNEQLLHRRTLPMDSGPIS